MKFPTLPPLICRVCQSNLVGNHEESKLTRTFMIVQKYGAVLQGFTLDDFQTSTDLYIPEDCSLRLRQDVLRISDV